MIYDNMVENNISVGNSDDDDDGGGSSIWTKSSPTRTNTKTTTTTNNSPFTMFTCTLNIFLQDYNIFVFKNISCTQKRFNMLVKQGLNKFVKKPLKNSIGKSWIRKQRILKKQGK